MSTRIDRGSKWLIVTTPNTSAYGGYAETTDVWSAGTKILMRVYALGPGTVTVKSYGGKAVAKVDGATVTDLDGLDSTGQSQDVALSTWGWHEVTIENPSDHPASYAFAYLDVPTYPPPTATYLRGAAELNEHTPDISNYAGYADNTDVWVAGTYTVMTFDVPVNSLVLFYTYGGNAKVNIEGTFQRSTIGRLTSGSVQGFAAPSTGTPTVTVTDPADASGSSYALAKVELYGTQKPSSFGRIVT